MAIKQSSVELSENKNSKGNKDRQGVLFEKESNDGSKCTKNEVLRKCKAEGNKEGTDTEVVDLSVRVVKEYQNWKKVKSEESNRAETRINATPVILD